MIIMMKKQTTKVMKVYYVTVARLKVYRNPDPKHVIIMVVTVIYCYRKGATAKVYYLANCGF